METIQAVLMGFVQGLSEFLPISSSAHIVFVSALYKIATGKEFTGTSGQEEIFFDIIIHLATLLAVFIFFKKDIWAIISSFFRGLKTKKYDTDFKMGVYIIIGTFISASIAFLFKDFAHDLVNNPKIVCILLVVTGFILFFSEKFKDCGKNLTLKNSVFIGIAQGLAIFPGLSRSGLTIATGLFQGIDRVRAARYSFLLSIPIIIAASTLYPLIELDLTEIPHFNWKAIILGAIVSFITGYFCIKYFMQFLAKSTLKSFAYYCWVVGVLMFVLFQYARHL